MLDIHPCCFVSMHTDTLLLRVWSMPISFLVLLLWRRNYLRPSVCHNFFFLLTDDYIEKNLKRHIVSLFFCLLVTREKRALKTRNKQTLRVIVSTFFIAQKRLDNNMSLDILAQSFFFKQIVVFKIPALVKIR